MKEPEPNTPDIFRANGLLTIREACARTGISRSMIYELEKEGLRIVRFSPKKVFVRETDLTEFILHRIERASA